MSEEHAGIEVAVVSGLSGAGRSTAAKCLEDLGWFVVDNLPPELIATMVDLGARSSGAVTRVAVVMDVRSRAFTEDLGAVIKDLDARGYKPKVLFRKPPTSADPPFHMCGAVIRCWGRSARRRRAAERSLLSQVRPGRPRLDTTGLSVHQLWADRRRSGPEATTHQGHRAVLR